MTVYPCRRDPELFTAPDGEQYGSPDYNTRVEVARMLCIHCPIMIACRDRGRELRAPGIWGGETDDERDAAGYPTPETVRRSHKAKHETRRKVAA